MRPTCAHCGKPYGQRYAPSETVIYKSGEPYPEYKGNGIVIRVRIWNTGKSSGAIGGRPFESDSTVAYRDIWDGETYMGGCKPFCTNKCAIDYARKAFKIIGSIKDGS